MKIRKARKVELRACAKMHMQFEIEESKNPEEDERITLEKLKKNIKSPDYTILVAEESGKVIGYTSFKYHKWNNGIWVEQLFVRKDFHRKGIGTELLKGAIDSARKMKARIIFVDTRKGPDNEAIKFYKKNGFSIAGHIRDFYKKEHGKDALVLSYRLE